MSNTRNMNQANNLWDLITSLQNNLGALNFADGRVPPAEFDPFEGQQFWGPWAQHGRRNGSHGHGRRGPPPPAEEGQEPQAPFDGPPAPPSGNESDETASPRGPGPDGRHHHGPHTHPQGPPHRHGRGGHRGPPPPPEHDRAMPPPPQPFDEPLSRSPTPPTPPETPAEPHHHPRSQSPRHNRGHSPHAHGTQYHRGPFPHHRRGRGFGGRGGHHSHPRNGNNGPALPFDLSALAEAFAPALFGGNAFGGPSTNTSARDQNANTNTNTNHNDGKFTPTVDLFSTPTSYILHASLPGAKKPEIDVTYSATRNSITISGVVTRPDVSETMMNCLVTDERREVGMFEREIRLEEGVKIAEENISAKLEDGVLRVIVPKVVQDDEEGWESVRKVELE